jgi:uncharacterized membrane protein YbhN (UPF0104 family)
MGLVQHRAPSLTVRWRGPRFFATPAEAPRARRSTDVLLLVGSIAGLAVTSVVAEPQPGVAGAVTTLLTSLPSFLDGLWQLLAGAPTLLAVALLVAALVSRRTGLARDLVLAALLAALVWLLVGRWVLGSWPEAWDVFRSAEPPPNYPASGLAVPGAAIITASPHLARPVRQLGRRLLGIAAVAVVALAAANPLGAVAGLLVAAVAAAVVHLVFGSCGGRPGLHEVQHAMEELGVPVHTVGAADRQLAGLFLVNAVAEGGEELVVKVYGRDAHDSALITTLWRTLWYREAGSPLRLGRLQQVEHEAFLTLLAHQSGVPTDTVVTAGATRDDDALLVLRRNGRPLADAGVHAVGGPETAARHVWSMLELLHGAGIAHGQVDAHHLAVMGDRIGLRDFRGGTVAASDVQERTDEVQAYVATILLCGAEVATAIAVESLGEERFAAVLPYLQPVALTPSQRAALKERDVDLDDLRADAADTAGEELPDLQRMRRISAKTVVSIALPAVALFALISAGADLDWEQLAEDLRNASWALVALGFAIGQTPRFTQALSTLGASPVPLALGPVYALQLAVSYVNLAIPSSAARIAVNIRFFQRHGVPPGSAVAVGALDGFSGFVVQATLLATILLLTPVSLDLDLDSADTSAIARLLVMLVAIVAVAIVVVLVVPKLRRTVWTWVRRMAAEAWSAVRGLRSPRRIGLLVGGNLATELLFATTLATFVQALGFSVGIGEVLLVNISVALLAGVLPIPGGIGVSEGGLTLGLVQLGVPQEPAFAAVMLYRLATFYLPPIWGFFALRWLERGKHL